MHLSVRSEDLGQQGAISDVALDEIEAGGTGGVAARSYHPGGVNVAFADGAFNVLRNLPNPRSLDAWRRSASQRGVPSELLDGFFESLQRFEAAHFLPHVPPDHKCRRMHGHSYRCEIHVTGPVAVAGGTIAPRLVTRVLNDLGDDHDQLPLVQHALSRTWAHWAEGRRGDARGGDA